MKEEDLNAEAMSRLAVEYWKMAQSTLIQMGDYETAKLFDRLFEKWDEKERLIREINELLAKIDDSQLKYLNEHRGMWKN